MLAFIKKLSPNLLVILLLISLSINVYYLLFNKIDKNTTVYDDRFPETQGVVEIKDGDTIVLNNNFTVRLIGINAPEKGEKNYEKSKDYLSKLLPDSKQVFLEYDRYLDDPYKRTLAWVWIDCESDSPKFLPANYMHKSQNESNEELKDNPEGCKNGKLVNEEMVKSGFAKVEVYKDRGKLKYQSRIQNITN